VVKFIEVDRDKEEFTDAIANLNKEAESLRKNIKKFETQISRSIKKFKI
jgi:chaperonin cofactor prefoldin